MILIVVFLFKGTSAFNLQNSLQIFNKMLLKSVNKMGQNPPSFLFPHLLWHLCLIESPQFTKYYMLMSFRCRATHCPIEGVHTLVHLNQSSDALRVSPGWLTDSEPSPSTRLFSQPPRVRSKHKKQPSRTAWRFNAADVATKHNKEAFMLNKRQRITGLTWPIAREC